MSNKTFNFQTQLAIGKEGEALFLSKYPDLQQTDGRKGDFVGKSGRKIELKIDTYSMEKTGNFFIERFSDLGKEKPGGPFQSEGHDVYYFCYLFVKQGFIYWFELKPLLEFLRKNEASYEKRYIKNRGWTTLGYLVPRSSLEHLIVLKENVIPINEEKA